jgi:hypothetical protein
LNEAIQREKVSIGKALDGSRFKKVHRANKTPTLNLNGRLEKDPEDDIVSPKLATNVSPYLKDNRSPSMRNKKLNPSGSK